MGREDWRLNLHFSRGFCISSRRFFICSDDYLICSRRSVAHRRGNSLFSVKDSFFAVNNSFPRSMMPYLQLGFFFLVQVMDSSLAIEDSYIAAEHSLFAD
jgi:hypothetical protein